MSRAERLLPSVSRAERLLPWACLAAVLVIFVSELQTMFELTSVSGEPLDHQSGGERHGYALLVVAAFAAAATVFAVWAGSRPAAVAVAAMGVVALLVFLLIDLPDAGQTGLLEGADQSFTDAEANAQGGFWLLLVGALGLTLSGVALATLSAGQLAELRPGRGRRAEPGQGAEPGRGSPRAGDA